MCTLFLPDEDKVLNISVEHLEPVEPEKGNRVGVICYYIFSNLLVFFDFLLTVKVAPHECVIRTGQL